MIAFVRSRWRSGYSAGVIAGMLGLSRNQVIGIVHCQGITRSADWPVHVRPRNRRWARKPAQEDYTPGKTRLEQGGCP